MNTQVDRATHISPEQFLSRMGGAPHTVRVYDLALSQLGPNATLSTPPMSSIAGDMVSLRIDRGALTANGVPEICASSPTGGVAIAIEPQSGGAPGAASKVHVNVALEPLIGGSLDHRTVYLEDARGRRLLALNIPLADAPKQQQYETSAGGAPKSVGVPAPFTEEDSHNGKNQVLAPGQEFVVVLKDNAASSGHRWADRVVDNPYFALIDTSYHASGDAPGAGGSRVYRFQVKEDALRWHRGQKQVPAALSIYQLAPGETFEKRTTRGDGSGPEFYLNTVIVNEQKGRAHEIRSGS